MIRPPSGSTGTAARVVATAPMTLICHWRSRLTVSSSGSSTVLPCTAIAALLTRMSSLPKCATTLSTSGLAAAVSAWSLRTASARTPFASSLSTTAAAFSSDAT